MAPNVSFVGISGVVGMAAWAGDPVARHKEENPPFVWLLICALSMTIRLGPLAKALISWSAFVIVTSNLKA
jgi:uncharacterized membrane protein YsdA (DUF1294 family)